METYFSIILNGKYITGFYLPIEQRPSAVETAKAKLKEMKIETGEIEVISEEIGSWDHFTLKSIDQKIAEIQKKIDNQCISAGQTSISDRIQIRKYEMEIEELKKSN